MENFPGYYSSHKPRIEGELAEKRKAPSVGHMAPIIERMVEQMGVEPTTYTMRTYRSSQLSYCPTKKYPIIYSFPGKKQARNRFFSKNSLDPRPGKPRCLGRSGLSHRLLGQGAAVVVSRRRHFPVVRGGVCGTKYRDLRSDSCGRRERLIPRMLPGQGGNRNFFSTFFGFELDFCRIGGKLNSIVLQMGY